MKRIIAVSVLLCALLFQGCASVRYSEKGDKTMVDIVNTGWYLLNLIPLASGNPEAPNECSFRLFRQTTTLKNNVRLLDWAIAEKNACSARSINSYWTDESILFILLKRHTCHTSAELVMPSPSGTPDDGNPICELQNM